MELALGQNKLLRKQKGITGRHWQIIGTYMLKPLLDNEQKIMWQIVDETLTSNYG